MVALSRGAALLFAAINSEERIWLQLSGPHGGKDALDDCGEGSIGRFGAPSAAL